MQPRYTDTHGAKKTIWMSDAQLGVLAKLQEKTGDSMSLLIRVAMEKYLKELEA